MRSSTNGNMPLSRSNRSALPSGFTPLAPSGVPRSDATTRAGSTGPTVARPRSTAGPDRASRPHFGDRRLSERSGLRALTGRSTAAAVASRVVAIRRVVLEPPPQSLEPCHQCLLRWCCIDRTVLGPTRRRRGCRATRPERWTSERSGHLRYYATRDLGCDAVCRPGAHESLRRSRDSAPSRCISQRTVTARAFASCSIGQATPSACSFATSSGVHLEAPSQRPSPGCFEQEIFAGLGDASLG
jgi:hypothetical protein